MEEEDKPHLVEFEYQDDTFAGSLVKEGVLYFLKLENIFRQMGKIPINRQIISFIAVPAIRNSLERIVQQGTTIDLSSPDLPFLLKAELARAYFHNQISNYVSGLPEIEICLYESWIEDFSREIGYEVFKALGKKISAEQKEDLKKILESDDTRAALKVYELAFASPSEMPGLMEDLIRVLAPGGSSSLAIHPSSGLVVSDIGETQSINDVFNAFEVEQYYQRNMFRSPLETAMHNDYYRKVFQVERKFPETGKYKSIRFSAESYDALPPGIKKMLNKIMIRNLIDGQLVSQVDAMFPSEIPENAAIAICMRGFFKVAENGITQKKGKYYFDNDISSTLDKVAIGAQYLISNFSNSGRMNLAVFSTQPHSEQRRQERNDISQFFDMMVSLDRPKEDLPPFTALDQFGYYGITDSNEKKNFNNAFRRLYGKKGFIGQADGDPRDEALFRIDEQGKIICAREEYIALKDEEELEFFDPFEYIRRNSDDSNFRTCMVEHNLDLIMDQVKGEIQKNLAATQGIYAESGKADAVMVDDGILAQLVSIGKPVLDKLAEFYESIGFMIPFIMQDYSHYRSLLGVKESSTKEEITAAYHRMIKACKAHPDMVRGNLDEMIRAGIKLNELKRARDELVTSIGSEIGNGISTYLGRITSMFEQ